MANWVSAGCGVIANELAQAMEKRGQKLYGVVNRTQEKAVAFAEKYGVQNVFTSFEEICEDPAVDIIYISTPHNTHIQFLRKSHLQMTDLLRSYWIRMIWRKSTNALFGLLLASAKI